MWSEITADEHYVEQRVGGLPKFDEFGIEGQIDLVGRDTDGVRVVDWNLGVNGGSHDSLQMLIYGLWAAQKFQATAGLTNCRLLLSPTSATSSRTSPARGSPGLRCGKITDIFMKRIRRSVEINNMIKVTVVTVDNSMNRE